MLREQLEVQQEQHAAELRAMDQKAKQLHEHVLQRVGQLNTQMSEREARYKQELESFALKAEAAEVSAMSIDDIKQELTELGVEFAADSDKAKLVSELLNARAFNRPMFDSSEFSSQFGSGRTQW